MPYYFISASFPATKAKEVAQTYIEEKKKYPTDRSLGKVMVEAVKSTDNGIETVGIIKVKEGKLEEALRRQQDIHIMYHDIEGYKYKLEVWWTAVEAIKMVGLEPPEE